MDCLFTSKTNGDNLETVTQAQFGHQRGTNNNKKAIHIFVFMITDQVRQKPKSLIDINHYCIKRNSSEHSQNNWKIFTKMILAM